MAAHQPAFAVQALRPPTFLFNWNGELRLLDVDAAAPVESAPGTISIHAAVRCCTEILVKRIPRALVDGCAVDFNIQLSAAMENEKTLLSGMIHMLQTLTCHTGRPGDGTDCYMYVGLEHCDHNLEQAVALTQQYIHSLRGGEVEAFDEDAAPLMLWRARRSVARQLVSGVAFLHRTGIGSLRRIYHNNLKPSNVLLKNGIVKLSEINSYSYGDAIDGATTVSPIHSGGICAPCSTPAFPPTATSLAVPATAPVATGASRRDSIRKDELSIPRAVFTIKAMPGAPLPPSPTSPVPAYNGESSPQDEFIPPLTLAEVEEIDVLAAGIRAAAMAKGESVPTPHPPATGTPTPGSAPTAAPPSGAPSALVRGAAPVEDMPAALLRLYKLRGYRDTFALGCLIFYTL